MKDIADQVALREQLAMLRAAGYGPLLEALENPLVRHSGRVAINRLAAELRASEADASAWLSHVRALVSGATPWSELIPLGKKAIITSTPNDSRNCSAPEAEPAKIAA